MMVGKFVLIIALIAISSNVVRSNHDEEANQQAWTEVMNSILRTYNTPRFSPDGILDLLRYANHLYEKLLYKDEATQEIGKIRQYIKAGESLWLRCDLDSFEQLRKLQLEIWQRLATQYPDYISNLIEKHFKHCKDKLADDLKNAVQLIDSDAQESVKLLSDKLKEVGKSKNYFNDRRALPSDLNSALAEFMKSQPFATDQNRYNSTSDDNKGKELYKEDFENSIHKVCKIVDKALRPSFDSLAIVVLNERHADQFDDYTKDWIIRGQACRTILSNKNNVVYRSYEELVNRIESPKKRVKKSSFMSACFGKSCKTVKIGKLRKSRSNE